MLLSQNTALFLSKVEESVSSVWYLCTELAVAQQTRFLFFSFFAPENPLFFLKLFYSQ